MRSFIHIDVRTVREACTALKTYKGKAILNAGGTDLLSRLKGEFMPDYPKAVINVKTIPNLDYVREDGEKLRIGALAKLSDLARSDLLNMKYKTLAESARSVATPQIRNVATIGGNLCQEVRCWYYRYPASIGGAVGCLRKGNGPCLAVKGDNRYHAIIGGRKCFAVCPSDTATALAALDAQVTIAGPKGERKVLVADFYHPLHNVLAQDEMVTEIEIPKNNEKARQMFIKFTLRNPVDFAVVSVASVITLEGGICRDARIVLGAVAPGPVRVRKAEEYLMGRPLDRESAVHAAELAVFGARPLSTNAYKVEIAKALVERAIMAPG